MIDCFDMQVQCEEFYRDDTQDLQRELELEEMRWRESEEFCAYVNMLCNAAYQEVSAY